MFANKVRHSIILESKGKTLGEERKVLALIKSSIYLRVERCTWGALWKIDQSRSNIVNLYRVFLVFIYYTSIETLFFFIKNRDVPLSKTKIFEKTGLKRAKQMIIIPSSQTLTCYHSSNFEVPWWHQYILFVISLLKVSVTIFLHSIWSQFYQGFFFTDFQFFSVKLGRLIVISFFFTCVKHTTLTAKIKKRRKTKFLRIDSYSKKSLQ
jgi:hypothetical protein